MEEVRRKNEARLLTQTLAGLSLLGLVMFGAAMTVYELIAPEGWIAHLVGRALTSGAAALVSLIVIGVLAWLSREWIAPARRNRYVDLMLYAFAGAGLAFVAKLWLTGTL